jgi:acyl-CoA synthetase (AMP-forming)/AMP-acid ligase II/acyl carrier protein
MFEIADLWKQMSQGGSRPFVIHRDRSTSYDEMRSLVGRAYATLQAMSLAPGERVGVLLQDEAMASAAFAASLLTGLVPVMLPPDIGAQRLDSIRRTIEPRLIVRDASIFSSDEPTTIEPLPVPRDELAYLLFTSGTTATPSGVEITRGNLCSHIDTLIRLFDFRHETRIFNPTPIAHTDGLIFGSLLTMATGGAVIRPGPLRLPEFAEWIGLMRRHNATHMMTNPTVLSLINRIAERDDYFSFDGFKGVLSGGSQLRRDLWLRFEDRFKTEIWNLYGLTETVTTVLYSGRHPEMGPVGTLGKAIDCEARIAPPVGIELNGTDDTFGELQVRGPHIFRGYWRNPERTASTFAPGNWMRTGDLVGRNDDGSYVFLGRVKTAINSGGTLIRGEEIDECLLRHPAVEESITVGLPDHEFEEIAVSAVVLNRAAEEAELTLHCRTELEALKVPKRIVAMDLIPRGDAGKPNLQAVRQMLEAAMRPAERRVPSAADQIDQQLIELAAAVFGVEQGSLSLSSTPDTVAGWDSFKHVNLVLQAEDQFSVRIPGNMLPTIKSLADIGKLVRNLRETSS